MNKPQKGFSLVEMLVVIALIAAVVGLALPSFLKAQSYAKVNNTANQLYTGLIRARATAMRKQRPVLITATSGVGGTGTKPALTFTAKLDADFSTAPGPSNGDTPLIGQENPFPDGQLKLVAQDFSFGYPGLSPSAGSFNARRTNMPGSSTNWFGFDASGRLIPNGQPPFGSTADVTAYPSYPDTAVMGGPEFYFAEANAAAVNRANAHVYRRIEIGTFGAVRLTAWDTNANAWKGVQ